MFSMRSRTWSIW